MTSLNHINKGSDVLIFNVTAFNIWGSLRLRVKSEKQLKYTGPSCKLDSNIPLTLSLKSLNLASVNPSNMDEFFPFVVNGLIATWINPIWIKLCPLNLCFLIDYLFNILQVSYSLVLYIYMFLFYLNFKIKE